MKKVNIDQLSEDRFDKIWKDVWNNATNDDTDEDLRQEHNRLCIEYLETKNLKN